MSAGIEQLSLAEACIAEQEAYIEEPDVVEALEDRAKVAIQTASQYMGLAHKGKRLLVVEVGLPDLESEDC